MMSKATPNLLSEALALHQAGRLPQAAARYRKVLQAVPDEPNALRLLGVIELQGGDLDAAEALFARAIKARPTSADSHYFAGRVGVARKDTATAERHFLAAVGLDPRHADALTCLGNLGLENDDPAGALDFFRRALAVNPGLVDARVGEGQGLGRLGRNAEALAAYDRALGVRGDLAAAWHGRGNALFNLMRYDDALAALDRAIAIAPNDAATHNERGQALIAKKRFAEARAAFDRAIALEPGLPFACGFRLQARMEDCDWPGIDAEWDDLRARIDAGELATSPFPLLAMPLPADYQRRTAAACLASGKFGAWTTTPWQAKAVRHDRIRVAYLSSDYRDHPVSFLTVGLFEAHDRTRFDITAMSLSPEPPAPSPPRERIRAAADRFVCVHDKTDDAIVKIMREGECDIAVDLNGFTVGQRFAIFGSRAAPVQVNYLGYPATMGADFIDYILADRFVVPPGAQSLYAEKVVWLPDVFQSNDAKREISAATPSRVDMGLPETGFVFCAFNASYKIAPATFAAWMRLLAAVDGSVLWVAGGDNAAARNLRREAQAHGIAPARIVSSARAPYAEYLARYRLADLFLDTLPFNGGTTTSDALWAGLPVLTLPGEAFASRMSGSLLTAAGLPELIATSQDDYEAIALRLAREPARLAGLKARLAANRATGPLFDTARFTRHLEAAYATMWERHQRGEPPASFSVPPAM